MLALALAVLLCAAPAQAQTTNQINVKFAPTAMSSLRVSDDGGVATSGLTDVDRLNQQFQATAIERVFRPAGKFEERHRKWGLDRWYRIQLGDGADAVQAASAYLSSASVESASPVYEKKLHGRPTYDAPTREAAARLKASRTTGSMAPFFPDDPRYGEQWHYDNTGQTNIPADGEVGTPGVDVNLPEAHEITTGSPDVIVSIVDSGLDLDHPDFQGALWINSAEDINGNGTFDRTPAEDGGDLNGIDDDNNGYVDDVVGYDFADDDPIPETVDPGTLDNSHGTHVAGTVAARNNNATGVAGVAGGDGSADSGVRLMITQTFANEIDGFAESVVYAADNGAVISNNSWGYTQVGVFEQPVLDAIDYFNANAGGPNAPIDGGIYVGSAGNSDSSGEWYPGFYEGTYSVSSTEDTDSKSSFSNYGSWVDVAAPGGQFGIDGVISTVHRDAGEYASFSGTSMSAPHIAGAAALIASEMPGMTAEQVKALLANSGVNVDDLNPGFILGRRLDILNALQGPDDTAPATITDLAIQSPSTNAVGTSVTLTWTASGDDGTTGIADRYDLRYSVDGPITDANFDAATVVEGVPAPDSAGTAESFTVQGLPFDTDIWFAIQVQDEFLNTSGVSNSPSTTTEAGPSYTVSTDSVGVDLLIGESATETFTISNTDDESLDVSFFGFAAQSVTSQPGVRLNDVSKPVGSSNHAKGSDGLAGDGRPVVLGAGGPDDYGYNWIDSNEDGGPTFDWVDISDDGTVIPAGDETVETISLPFDFSLYGESFSTVGVASNGYLTFGGTSSDFSNNPIPTSDAPNNLVAPFWDDLDVAASGTVYGYFDEDNDRYIIQWDNVAKYLSSDRFTFQVILYANGTVLFQYESMDAADSATIGLENADGTDGLQVAYNTEYVEDGLAVAIQSAPQYLSLSPTTASIAAGSSETFTVGFDAASLDQGLYGYTLEALVSDAASSAPVNVATGLNVTGAPFPLELSETSFSESLAADESVVRTLSISNPTQQKQSFDIELRGIVGQAPEFQPRLKGEALAKYERMSESLKSLAGSGSASLDAAPTRVESVFDFVPTPMEGIGLDAYSTSLVGDLSNQFVTFDLNEPEQLTGLGPSPTAYAGDFAVGQQDRFYVITTDDNAFHSIELDGTITTFGVSTPQASDETWTELASDPTDGTLYATSSNGSNSYLYTIDPTDGTATRVATIQNAEIVIGIAIDEFGTIYGLEIVSDELIEIDSETGATTTLGSVGFNANFAQGMDYDLATGRLYLAACRSTGSNSCAGELRIANTETGATQVVGPLGAGDELGYLALNSVGFVQPNLLAGTIAAGATVDVDLTISADGLYEGTYDGELTVISDQPGNPSESVDVNLEVDADPNLFVDTDSLAYDSLFVGLDQTKSVLVSNTGRAPLDVSLSIDEGDFALADASNSSFTLPAGVSRVVDVVFTPSTAGAISGTLTLTGGPDGPATVALTGVGVPPPEVELEPTAFDLQAYPGQQYTRTLTMTNTGGSPLIYNSTESVVSQPNGAAPNAVYEDLALEEDFEEGLPSSWQVVDNAGSGVVWQLNGDYNRANFAGTGNAAAADSDRSGSVPYDTELISPWIEAGDGMNLEFLVNFQAFLPDDDQFFDVDVSTDSGSSWTNALRLDDDTPPGGLFVENGGAKQNIALDPYVSEADSFQVRFRYYTTSGGFDWYAQIDDVKVVRNRFEYVTYSPVADTLAPGESLDLTYAIDATGLPGGTYEVDYTFNTNAPATPQATVPFTLNVIESLSVTPEPEVGTDSLVHPNEEFVVPLTVESLDDLAVESFATTLDFDPTLFEAVAVETEGTLSEGLTLASSLSDSTVTVAAAEGAAPDGVSSPVLFSIEGEGALVNVRFRAKEALGTGSMSVSEIVFNEGKPPASGFGGSVLVSPLYGDASLDLDVNAYDAALVLQSVVGLQTLGDAATTSGEVSGDGTLSAFDASLILNYASGLIDCFPVESGCDASLPVLASAKSGDAPSSLAWGSPTVTRNAKSNAASSESGGQVMELPLRLTAGTDAVRAFEIRTQIDAKHVDLESVSSRLPDGWTLVHSKTKDGRLHLAAAGAQPLSNGTVAAVEMRWLTEDASLAVGGQATVNETAPKTMADATLATLPEEFALLGNYPNPVRSSTQIGLDLPANADVSFEVYDLLGRRVQSVRKSDLEAGSDRRVQLNVSSLSSGVYFYRVTVQMGGDRQVDTGRMTVVK